MYPSEVEFCKLHNVSECPIPATGDHPDMIGYMVGPDDGVSTLYRTPEEAVAAHEKGAKRDE